METPNPGNLSMLPLDVLRSLFERMSFVDFHRAKMVCSNWFSGSKQTVHGKSGSPWLILFTDNCCCVLYDPEEDKVYRSLRDFSGTRFLANSDEKTEDYVVVYFFDSRPAYLTFCKKGDDYYTYIPLYLGIPKLLNGLSELVLRGYRLYISTTRNYIRVIDLSGQNGLVELTESIPYQLRSPRNEYSSHSSIAVTTAGEILLVESITIENHRSFHVYKKDPNLLPDCYRHDLLEVDSLGDEALLLDLGITVPANRTLGIKANSIYFTRHDRACLRKPYNLDICVFNLASKTVKRFSDLTNMNFKDARWFLPLT